MIEGQLIVIEGVDGAGTTTHTRLLADNMAGRGLPVHATREPSDGPVGMLLRQILTGRVVVPGLHGDRPSSWTTMALLFAADRLDHLESEITPNLMDGVNVISDRYVPSSVAYQSLTSGAGADVVAWVKEVNRRARTPDLTIVLDIPAEVAAERRRTRTRGRDLYDDEALQLSLCDFYRTMETHFPGERFVHVDSNRNVEAVSAEIMAQVRKLRGEA